MKSFFLGLVFFTFSFHGFSQKELRYEDFTYEENIKTVQFYTFSGQVNDRIRPPVIELMQTTPLTLEFDELGGQFHRYFVKILHCNADWTKSNLSEIQYVFDYNEYPIQNYAYSFNTYTKYIHYQFQLPKVKTTGNYILMVYREGDQDDVVITRRFMVYQNQVNIIPNVRFSTVVENRQTAQQVDFSIDYSNYDLASNPWDVKVLIRQNYRWDNAIVGLQPLYNRREERLLDYNFFNGENNFWGLNEFRQFDLRSLRFPRMNVASINIIDNNQYKVVIYDEKSRGKELYTNYPDINGRYYIDRYESSGNGGVEGDYANVVFSIKGDVPEGNIHVVGAFNDYAISESNKLKPNEKGVLECIIPLKQGYYNYLYTLVNKRLNQRSDKPLENSFNFTENIYEIFVYYRPVGTFNDILVGYSLQNFPK